MSPTHVVEHNPPDYDIPDLIEGSIYTVTWTMTDAAGNTSLATYKSTNVEFDAALPSVNIVASRYLVGFPYTLTITATFSEPMEATLTELLDPDLVPPKMSIDFQPLDENNAPFYDLENITMTEDVRFIDSTVFYIEVPIPDCDWEECSGTVAVSIAAQDRAGNLLPEGTIDFPDTLLRIDNLSPTCNLQYVNITQDWLNIDPGSEGKSQDMIQIRGDFNKTIGLDPPMISGQFLGSTDIFTDLLPDSSIRDDTTHFWSFIILSLIHI